MLFSAARVPGCKIGWRAGTTFVQLCHQGIPGVRGLGSRTGSTRSWSCPTPAFPCRPARSCRGAVPGRRAEAKNALRGYLSAAGIRWNTPFDKMTPRSATLVARRRPRFPAFWACWNENSRQPAANRTGVAWITSSRGGLRPNAHGATRPEARSIAFAAGQSLNHRADRPQSAGLFESLRFPDEEQPIAEPIVSGRGEVRFLDTVRARLPDDGPAADTLSGGLQRVRLAAGLGSGLVGVCRARRTVDRAPPATTTGSSKPSATSRRQHGRRGRTTRRSPRRRLIDLGPGCPAGRSSPQEPRRDRSRSHSITGGYLGGRKQIPTPRKRRRLAKTRSITIEGVTTNNLKDVTVWFPLSALACVTGVSGSGKSSLLNETFARALVRRLGGIAPKPGPHRALRGGNCVDKVIQIDQTPIGRTPRSNPATYSGVFDESQVFANTRAAKQRGYKAGRFSFNVKGLRGVPGPGAAEDRDELPPDLYVTCPVCVGKRFNRQTLKIRYRDLSIADVLDMRIDESVAFFENFPLIARLLGCLRKSGWGTELGQPSTSLGRRVATGQAGHGTGPLGHRQRGHHLDEPTTGLHRRREEAARSALALVDLGNTVIVIEHNLQVIKTADHRHGPRGRGGGGSPPAREEIAAVEEITRGCICARRSTGSGQSDINQLATRWRSSTYPNFPNAATARRPETAATGSQVTSHFLLFDQHAVFHFFSTTSIPSSPNPF